MCGDAVVSFISTPHQRSELNSRCRSTSYTRTESKLCQSKPNNYYAKGTERDRENHTDLSGGGAGSGKPAICCAVLRESKSKVDLI